MNLINNRYRIIENLKQDRFKSSYLVSDVVNNHEKIQFNIINSEFASDSFIDFCVTEFSMLETINHSNICKVFDFGLVHTIDNKKVNDNDYFYTNSYVMNIVELHDIITDLHEDEILDIFMQLCLSVNYLHIRGFIYGEVSTENIMVYYENNKYNISLKDLTTIKIQKKDYNINNELQLNFKAPEYILDNKPTILTDIYSMGVVLLDLCKGFIHQKLSINESILDFKNKLKNNNNSDEFGTNLAFYDSIIRIIEKMAEQNLSIRYNNINNIVKDINEFFDKRYKAFIIDEIEKLNFNTKIVGRNTEIIKILNEYENLTLGNPSNKIILVKGEQGIGKTRFLKEIEHLIYMKKANVYSSFVIENRDSKSNRGFVDILKKLVSFCDNEILNRYQNELIKFIPELGVGNNIVAFKKEKFRLISRIYSFIIEAINNEPTVFIIDNAHYFDDFSLELLEFINVQNHNEQNLMIILSYNTGEYVVNNKFQLLLNKNYHNQNIILNNLNKEETTIMIKGLFSMPTIPFKFGESVYAKTYGNPLFIEETLKDFAAKKIICINENNGKWRTPFENLDELPIASTMEQALLNQIKEINKGSYEILSNISIFSTAISIEVIEKLYIDTDKRIENHIDELCSKGILCKKIEDMGFVFDFNNKVLKNLIYSRLSEDNRNTKHEIAASVLENLFKNEGRKNKEELIYHLEKANDKHGVVKYCIELAEEMKSFRIMDEAISKYEKALFMLSDEEEQNKKIEILLKIGDIYLNIGNLSGALENYEKTYLYSMDLVEEKLQVDCSNKMALVYMKRNEVEKSLHYIKIGESLLKNIEYMEGYLENKKNIAKAYIVKQEYAKVFDISTDCIKKCGNDYTKYKGLMYNYLGVVYAETSRPIDALECYRKSLAYFEEINYTKGMCRCLNNLGVIYGDHYQDNETAISYYNKFLIIAEENNIIDLELTALGNLATCYFDMFNYDVALNYFKNALKKSKSIESEDNIFYIYNYLSYIYLKVGENKRAYEYYLLAQKELEQYPIQGRNISIHYEMGAEFLYGIGNIDDAYVLIKRALKIYNNDDTIQDCNSKLLLLILKIRRSEKIEDIKKNSYYINIVTSDQNNTNKINALYEICMAMYEKGYVEEATNLFQLNSYNNEDNLVEIVNIKGLYLEGIICPGKKNIVSLMLALDLSKKVKNRFLQWRICSAVGDYYFDKRDYFFAVNYYFEACELIKDSTMQLPEQLRVNYINAFNMIRPFNMIKGISETYKCSKVGNLEDSNINISNNKDLTMLFNYSAFDAILNNKSFVESAQKIYSSILPQGIQNINDIITNMSEDPLQTLDVITKLTSSMLLSTRSLIISEGSDGEYSVVASSDGNRDMADIKLILQRVRETKNSILVSEPFNSIKNTELRFMPKGMKSIMCIPIIRKNHSLLESDKMEINNGKKNISKRINQQFPVQNIKGYLYMESDRVLNNFNGESLNKCLDLTSFISFIMENHLLKVSSSIDKLTGTLTRRFLEEALSDSVEMANLNQGVFSIIMFDLDNFKGVNDRFGHLTGDQVLRDVSKIVMDSIRKIDVCGRYGGEEFIVILPETDITSAFDIAERIRQNIENKKILGSKRELTVSMGISSYPQHGKWKQELIEKADKALYVAKANGKNKCQIWEEKFSGEARGTNKLLGIVSGNVVQDSRNVLAMVELIQIIVDECDLETKIFNALGRIIETTEAQNGMFFIVNENEISEKFARRIYNENWTEVKGYSVGIIESIISDKQGKCIIDWDSIIGYDLVTGMPNWNSVLAVPIIKSGEILGVLYLTVPIKVKEFKVEDLNFVSTLGQLLVGML